MEKTLKNKTGFPEEEMLPQDFSVSSCPRISNPGFMLWVLDLPAPNSQVRHFSKTSLSVCVCAHQVSQCFSGEACLTQLCSTHRLHGTHLLQILHCSDSYVQEATTLLHVPVPLLNLYWMNAFKGKPVRMSKHHIFKHNKTNHWWKITPNCQSVPCHSYLDSPWASVSITPDFLFWPWKAVTIIFTICLSHCPQSFTVNHP